MPSRGDPLRNVAIRSDQMHLGGFVTGACYTELKSLGLPILRLGSCYSPSPQRTSRRRTSGTCYTRTRFESSRSTSRLGRADVFYPEAENHRCTVALLLDIDPVGLVRSKPGGTGTGDWLGQYVNDRPYVASSHLSVAISSVFGSALAGKSRDRPDLAAMAIPLEVHVPVVPSREGSDLIRKLFEPLGYEVEVEGLQLDERFPQWGACPYFGVRLASTTRLHGLLAHLYVLLPVLDDDKHYWVNHDEVAKLLRFGEGWLGSHPLRTLISERYLKHQRNLVDQALAQLLDAGSTDPSIAVVRQEQEEERLEAPLRLGEQRTEAVLARAS